MTKAQELLLYSSSLPTREERKYALEYFTWIGHQRLGLQPTPSLAITSVRVQEINSRVENIHRGETP